jgi:PAS domain S-box-containing protein
VPFDDEVSLSLASMSRESHLLTTFAEFPISRVVLIRYAVAIGLVVLALCLSLLLHPLLSNAFLFFFIAAVMAAAWFGRTGPGLFSVAISTMLIDYYFIRPYHALAMEFEEVPYFLSFLLSAISASWLASARKRVEENQRAHFERLFEHGPEAIMLVDSRDRVQRINTEFSRIFGYSSAEILEGNSVNFIVPEHLRDEAIASRARLAQGESVSMETVRRRRDGSTVAVSEIAIPVVIDGERISYYFIFRDISETKRAADELQRAQAELAHLSRVTTMGELMASIAHEVNQPIAAVVTNSNAASRWLSQQPPNLNETREALDNIVRDATRASDVIGRIRSLVRKSETSMGPLDINEIIRGILVVLEAEIRNRGVRLQMDLGDVPNVTGDRIQLQQVTLNLVINAIEAMDSVDRPRLLNVQSSADGDFVLVQVRDSGAGIDADHIEAIFNPFFTTKREGLGMGLTISQSIVEAHAGRMWAESTNSGATLNLKLPAVTENERT